MAKKPKTTAERIADRLERDEETNEPIYLHHVKCGGFCDYACNGSRGLKAAKKIANEELTRTKGK